MPVTRAVRTSIFSPSVVLCILEWFHHHRYQSFPRSIDSQWQQKTATTAVVNPQCQHRPTAATTAPRTARKSGRRRRTVPGVPRPDWMKLAMAIPGGCLQLNKRNTIFKLCWPIQPNISCACCHLRFDATFFSVSFLCRDISDWIISADASTEYFFFPPYGTRDANNR